MKNSPTLSADDARLPAIVARLKAGATLTDESRALGFTHNEKLRRALRQYMGAKAYDELMQGRHGLGIQRWREAQAAKATD